MAAGLMEQLAEVRCGSTLGCWWSTLRAFAADRQGVRTPLSRIWPRPFVPPHCLAWTWPRPRGANCSRAAISRYLSIENSPARPRPSSPRPVPRPPPPLWPRPPGSRFNSRQPKIPPAYVPGQAIRQCYIKRPPRADRRGASRVLQGPTARRAAFVLRLACLLSAQEKKAIRVTPILCAPPRLRA
jgi:hypothetical protein